ncbi:hypothetical protein HMPREF3185_00483 [Porphyromonas somerae]|uniref:Uncharacterized protein n=1 Tax=Porphyromonas somerae TaxID=322095 RepID=A0A134BCD8_9PORP|nr:hypothetical protein HMPREF3184_00483 [Porphyromonadaceae bacterium KA00676]KXB77601.1 hypothetical protein HMPREF3185_00483 [Porphyromonas somerae]
MFHCRSYSFLGGRRRGRTISGERLALRITKILICSSASFPFSERKAGSSSGMTAEVRE